MTPTPGGSSTPGIPHQESHRPGPVGCNPSPTVGQHNRSVLTELLGYDDTNPGALDQWETDGLLGSKDRLDYRRALYRNRGGPRELVHRAGDRD